MAATSTDVDNYIAALPVTAREVTQAIRELIHTIVPSVSESISYKMPAFSIDGSTFIHVGAWKHHVGLYPVSDLGGDLESHVAPFRSTKDTLRFQYSKDIPYDVISRVIAVLVERQTASGSPR